MFNRVTTHPAALPVSVHVGKNFKTAVRQEGETMLSESDRRIDLMYRAGLERIKLLCHFHLPKCKQPGCFRKLNAKDDRLGHKLCGICYTAELKAKRLKKRSHSSGPEVKHSPSCTVAGICLASAGRD